MAERRQFYGETDMNFIKFIIESRYCKQSLLILIPSLLQAIYDKTLTHLHHAATITQTAQTDEPVVNSFEKQVRMRHQLSVAAHASRCRIRPDLIGNTLMGHTYV